MAQSTPKTDRIRDYMEAGLEHFDMGLVNYRQHPTNVNYIVYRFKDKQRADTFEALLIAEKLWFERSDPDHDEKEVYMFAIEKKYFKKSQKLNFLTESKHKKFLIPSKSLRYFFVTVMLALIVIGSVSYCKSRSVLQAKTTRLQTAP